VLEQFRQVARAPGAAPEHRVDVRDQVGIVDLTPQRPQRRRDRRVRDRFAADLDAAAVQDAPALLAPLVDDVLEQAALADPGLALEQQDARLAGRQRLDQPVEGAQLRLALEQRPAARRRDQVRAPRRRPTPIPSMRRSYAVGMRVCTPGPRRRAGGAEARSGYRLRVTAASGGARPSG
jgi:hypothetical protein